MFRSQQEDNYDLKNIYLIQNITEVNTKSKYLFSIFHALSFHILKHHHGYHFDECIMSRHKKVTRFSRKLILLLLGLQVTTKKKQLYETQKKYFR